MNYLYCLLAILVSGYILSNTILKFRMSYWDGVSCGFAFFIGGPLLQVIIFSEISSRERNLPALSIDNSNESVFLFLAVFSFIFYILYIINKKNDSLININININNLKVYFISFTAIYLFFAFYIFLLSGKLSGGHWYENYDALYSGSAISTVIGNFYNVMRICFPGVLIFAVIKKLLSNKEFIIISIIYGSFELLISSNRVIILLIIFSFILLFYKNNKKYIFLLVLISPLIMQFNHAFPIMRGLMFSENVSIEQLLNSYEVATDFRKSEGFNIEESVSGLFEADNLNVVKFVYDNFPSRYNYVKGETVYLKTATFFLPKAIWPNKPEGFGGFLGPEITGTEVLTLNSTIIGEAYGNFGLLALILVPLNLYLTGILFKNLHGTILNYCPFFIAFASWRFEFAFIIISAFALFIIKKFIYSKFYRKILLYLNIIID